MGAWSFIAPLLGELLPAGQAIDLRRTQRQRQPGRRREDAPRPRAKATRGRSVRVVKPAKISALALFVALAPSTCGAAASAAPGDGARVEVATLDGAPVHHWRVFKSWMADDVDRALVLREFQRKHFTLPPKILDAAVRENMAGHADGDVDNYARQLRQRGASPEDFRLFISEEVIISAMLYVKPSGRSADELARWRARWLAGLRQGATVKRLGGGETQ